MPALPVVPKVLKVVLRQTNGTDLDVLNILHYQYTGTAPSVADLTEMAADIFTSWNTNIAPNVVAQAVLDTIEIIDLSSATSAAVTVTGPSNAGSIGTEGVPAGTAMVMKYGIARRYRGGHPRSYVTGLAVNTLANANTWGATIVATFGIAWAAFCLDISIACDFGGGTGNQVNVSYFAGFTNHTYPSGRTKAIPTLRVTPLIDLITGQSVNPKVASQRRRNLQSS